MNFAISTPVAPAASTVPNASTAAATLQHKKLTEAAQQFEGMLMQELLKPMKEHGFSQDEADSGDEGSGLGDTLSSYGTETMATAIAKGGGLGIAKRVVAQVEGEKAAHHPAVGGFATSPK
jgi:flagellar protein FlgJ